MREKRKAKQRAVKKPKQETSADPLIEPTVLEISKLLQSGKLTFEEMAKPYTWKWSSSIPPRLVPFFESPGVSKLAEVLQAAPWLMAQPFVWKQILHLLRLSRTPKSAILDDLLPDKAREQLRTLVTAWGEGLFRGWTVKIKPSKRRGRPPMEQFAELLDYADEFKDWLTILSDKKRFKWRTLSREYRDDPDWTVDELASVIQDVYRAHFGEHLSWKWSKKRLPQISHFPIGPLSKLIRDGFEKRSPKRHIALGLVGFPNGEDTRQVRHILSRLPKFGSK